MFPEVPYIFNLTLHILFSIYTIGNRIGSYLTEEDGRINEDSGWITGEQKQWALENLRHWYILCNPG